MSGCKHIQCIFSLFLTRATPHSGLQYTRGLADSADAEAEKNRRVVDPPPRCPRAGGAPTARQRSPTAQAPCVVNSNRQERAATRAPLGRAAAAAGPSAASRTAAAPARPCRRRARGAPHKKRTSRYFRPHPDGGLAPPRRPRRPYVSPRGCAGGPAPAQWTAEPPRQTSMTARGRRRAGAVCQCGHAPPHGGRAAEMGGGR